MSLATELLKNFEPQIQSLSLVPGSGGRFEVSLDDRLIFSKHELGRHAEPGEVVKLVRKSITK